MAVTNSSAAWSWNKSSTTSGRRRASAAARGGGGASSRTATSLATPLLLLLFFHDQFSHQCTWCHASEAATTPSTNTSTSTSTSTATTPNIHLRLYLIRHGESAANKWGMLAGQDDVPLTDRGVFEAQTLGQRAPWTAVQLLDEQQQEDGEQRRPTFFWRLYSSDLVRAVNTATHLWRAAADTAAPPQVQQTIMADAVLQRLQLDVRLRERSYGARQGMSKTLTESEALRIWKSHNIEPPPYETDDDMRQRGSEWVLDVIRDLQEEVRSSTMTSLNDKRTPDANNEQEEHEETPVIYNVFVTSHAGLIRELVRHLFSPAELEASGAQFDATRNNRLMIPNMSVTIVELEIPTNAADDDEPTTTPVGPGERLLQTTTKRRLVQLANANHLDQVIFHDD
jgi:broad specificity phosphatase PhoE